MSHLRLAYPLALLTGIGVLTTAPLSAQQESTTDTAFKQIYSREWTWREIQNGPEGDDEDGPTRGVKPHLPKVDAGTQAAKEAYWTDVLRQLNSISPASLSEPNRVNYEVYRQQVQVLLSDQKFREFEKPLNSDSGFWMSLSATARMPFLNASDYRNYLSQLSEVPRYFGDQISNMRAGLKRGFTPSQITLVGREGSVASVTSGKTIQDCPLYAPFLKMPATVPLAEQAELRAAGAKVLERDVLPAYTHLLEFLKTEYIPGARKELAIEAVPDGKAYYQAKIYEFTTTELTPAQIHEIGLAEVAKIHAEMVETIQQTGFKGDFPAFLNFLRTDPQFYPKTADELLMRAAYIAKEFDGRSAQYFGYLPRMRFAIKPVPADLAPFYTGGRGGPGVYLVNTYDLPSRPFYSLPALTLHESAPGHAFQMPIILEHKDLPPFRRVYISAFGEGWALYCERLGTEMGSYHTPYEKFGMLSYQAWRASRLVVDTGLHSQGWTREQARQYLRDNTALSEHEIETETDRYIAWPAQALSYYLGEMEIQNDRKKAEAALGPNFNIRAFHDTVLSLGSVPLPVLEEQIDRFIRTGGVGPYPEME